MNKKGKVVSNDFKWDKKTEMYVPKASPLAYTIFIAERKEEIHKAQEKDDGEKPLSVKQIARKVRSDWRKLDADGKKKYLQMVEKEKKRYDIQMKEMEEKGYFTLKNGSKSSDLPAPANENMGKRRSTTPVKVEQKRPANKKKN